MGQTEVFEFLRNQRASGDERFWSIREIYKQLSYHDKHTTTIRHCVLKLLDAKLIETDNKWPKKVRIKAQYSQYEKNFDILV